MRTAKILDGLSSSFQNKKNEARYVPLIFSLNIATLPTLCGFQLNSSNLKSNAHRAKAIVKHILANNYDLVILQEAWSIPIANYFQRMLSEKYLSSARGVGRSNCILMKGGVMVFSRYEIVDYYAASFPRHTCSEEWLGGKGPQMLKIKMNPDTFTTVINCHVHSDTAENGLCGESFLKRLSQLFCQGALSDIQRRDEQFAFLSKKMQRWAKLPPEGSSLIYGGTLLAGDFNIVLNSEKEVLTDKNILPGQHGLFSQIKFNRPLNYNAADTVTAGTYRSAPDKKPAAILDGIFQSKDSDQFEAKTRMIWLKDENGDDVTDHASIVAELRNGLFSAPSVPEVKVQQAEHSYTTPRPNVGLRLRLRKP